MKSMKERRKGRRTEGKAEGRKGGRKGGRAEGGRAEGRKEGRKCNRNNSSLKCRAVRTISVRNTSTVKAVSEKGSSKNSSHEIYQCSWCYGKVFHKQLVAVQNFR
jgi:hypothetical protein